VRYKKVQRGIFLSRPNRFVAHVLIDGKEHIVHVKNTGRCREILQPEATVYLEDFTEDLRSRKTRYSLVAAEKPDLACESGYRMINIDSQAPNRAVAEALESGIIRLPGFESGLKRIKAEHIFGSSRFDFFVEGRNGEKALIEVKGVTLEDQGIVRFPDAPTERGVRHIYELMKALDEGYKAFVIFVVQMAAEKPDSTFESGYRLINIDSQAPNKAAAEVLESGAIQLPGFESGIKHIKAEHVFGSSRFDFFVEGRNDEKALIEIKGVTLEKQGATLFPDAPTERGVKHIYELIEAVDQGFKAFVIFIIQMQDVLYFEPNDEMHAAFGQALREAAEKGVQVLAYDCRVAESAMEIRQEVAVQL
jgi:sugar fermentation stimulation protein A